MIPPRHTAMLKQLACGNIAGLLSHAANEFGQRPAVVSDQVTTSFVTLAERAESYAASLLQLGMRPSDRVGIFMNRGAESAAAFFGVTGAGGIAVIVNEMYQPRQVEYILAHSGAGILLMDPALIGGLSRDIEFAGTRLAPEQIHGVAIGFPVARAPLDPGQLVYTSGSTGQPKGVLVSHGNLWAGAVTVAEYLSVCLDDRIASVLPFGFVYGLNQLMCCLVAGASLFVERVGLPQDLAAALREHRITMLATVPPLWLQLLRAPAFTDAPLPDLRVLTCAGGRLPPELALAVRKAQPQAELFLMYGLSEVFRSTFLSPGELQQHPDSMGRAIPGAQVFVVDEDLTICPPGVVGELVHRGPTVALGYWNDPEATDRVFRRGPLPTLGVPAGERVVFSGDLVRSDEAGRIYYVGRRDQIIKTLGYRISPDEVADVIHASGEVTEAVVMGEPDEVRGQRIVAIVALRSGGSVTAIRRYCAGELPRYMQPVKFVVLTSLPRGPAGKYDFTTIRRAVDAAG